MQSATADAALARMLTAMPQLAERIATVRTALKAFDEALSRILDASPLDSPVRECLRCGHRWRPRSRIFPPKFCPACNSTGWSTPPWLAWHRRPGDAVGMASMARAEFAKHRGRVRKTLVPRATTGLPSRQELDASAAAAVPLAPEPWLPPQGSSPGLQTRTPADEWLKAYENGVPEDEDLGLGMEDDDTEDAT